MRPEDFTASLRARVKDELTQRLALAQSSLEGDPTASLADLLVRLNIATPEHAQVLAGVVRALVNDQNLNDHMAATMAGYRAQPELEAVLHRLVADPTAVRGDELDSAIELLMNDDRLMSAPIKIMFENDEVRRILGIPADLTFDRYLVGARANIRGAATYEEFLEARELRIDGVLFSAYAGVAIRVYATVWALVHTAVAAVNYVAAYAVATTRVVFTVAGQGYATVPDSTVKAQPDKLESACQNDSEILVWVAIEDRGRLRRIPLPPGRDTREFGLTSIVGIIVGGPGNALTDLKRNGTPVLHGLYEVIRDINTPGVVRLLHTANGVSVEENDAQKEAESNDLTVVKPTMSSIPATLETIGAIVPPGFDYRATMHAAAVSQEFYRAMQFVDALKLLRRDAL